jgi:ABC-type transport system involved in multi-copper enzyme maturation permease subunit
VKTFAVAVDLLREARSRKWFIGLGLTITGVLLTLGVSLKLDVVDGALAAAHLFGHSSHGAPMGPVDVMLRPVFSAASQVIFYGGLLFGICSCCDFAPKLLSPGRIEHLLALPVRRWELLLGTFLGVLFLATAAAVYGAGGMTLLFGFKAGVWTIRPLLSGLLAVVAFVSVYAFMLAATLVVRSAVISAGAGIIVFLLGIAASNRDTILPMFTPGPGRWAANALTAVVPRITHLAALSADLAGSEHVATGPAVRTLLGFLAFGAAALAVAAWHFEGKDF